MKKTYYIDGGKKTYKVRKFNMDKEMKRGFAYIKGDYALPFRGDWIDADEDKPKIGIYLDPKAKGGYRVVKYLGKKKMERFHVDKIYEITDNFVSGIIEKEGLKNAEDLDILLGETTEIFAPVIDESDNALQKLIKRSLALKKISLKVYSGRFDDAGQVSNYKRALLHHGKMSLEKFIKWCNVLDLEFEIYVRDSENSIHPMGQVLKGN